ncbi:MAG: hypothetical protein WC007_09705 [Pelobacteraceae bacterium]
MVIRNAWRTLLLSVLISACISGCARPKPTGHLSIYNDRYATKNNQPSPPVADTSNQSAAVALSPFQEIVVSLVSDSIDILPKSTGDAIFDVILKGIEIPDQDDEIKVNVLSSPRNEDIAFVAGLIVQRVYGKSVEKGTTIPQAILYFYKDRVTDTDLTAAAAKVNLSENRTLDAYNASLNLLVNVLSHNSAVNEKPKNGLYVRDFKGDLYFRSNVIPMGM